MKRILWAAVSPVFALSACDTSRPTSPIEAGGIVAASRVAAAASGGGHAQLPPGFSLLRFSFGTSVGEDGTGRGQFSQRYESAGGVVDFHGVVTCMSVDAANGRAWVGGVITQNNSTNPATLQAIHEVGRDVWFRVLDGGEGEGAVDRTTVFGFTGAAGFITSAAYCAGQPWAAGDANTWEVVGGNIQVRP